MIINLRGTSGSGKSTIVRMFMAQAFKSLPYFSHLRRQPWGYYCLPSVGVPVWVVGHYETNSGGCDTIDKLDKVYELVRHGAEKEYHVLFEGLMVSGEARRCIELHRDGLPVQVIGLNTPLEDCLKAIEIRRQVRGITEPLDPARTIRRADEVRRMMGHLEKAGVPTSWMSREEALAECLKLLGVD